jgi:putative glycerol-1-phosphate prenyltransferase
MSILKTLRERHREGKKSIAVLVDPDKAEDASRLLHLTNLAAENCVDFFFVGGSLITTPNLGQVVKQIKDNVTIPVVLFPGNYMQVEPSADALLFLTLRRFRMINIRWPHVRRWRERCLDFNPFISTPAAGQKKRLA